MSKLTGEKAEMLLRAIESQDERTRTMCEQQLRFDVAYELEMKKKHDEQLRTIEEQKGEIARLKEALARSQGKHDAANAKPSGTSGVFAQAKRKQEQPKEVQLARNVLVCGFDRCCAKVEKPNKTVCNFLCIHPPMSARVDLPSLLSYSADCNHSVQVLRDGSLLAAGYNKDSFISSRLERRTFTQPVTFTLADRSGAKLDAASAVCLGHGTLYMASKSGGQNQLVLCHQDAGKTDVFLNAGDKQPVALFGGFWNAAAIASDGEIIFVNSLAVKGGSSRVQSFSLPGGEKASSVACCREWVFALSSGGRVFASHFEKRSSTLSFSAVPELGDKEIVCLSGSYDHCLAVSSDCRVFAQGSNSDGQLGLGKGAGDAPQFVEIESLRRYKISAAYAGGSHSLFETRDGQLLACGSNNFGQLILNESPKEDYDCPPTETTVTSGASFCITGNCMSVIFVGGAPPVNTPNMRVDWPE